MKKLQKKAGASAGSKKSSKDKTTTSTNIGGADTYGPKNESLIRDKSKQQMEELNRTIKANGGDIQDIVKRGEQTKEYQIPNAYYMDNPFDAKRTSIETQEHFTKNGAHYKSVPMKSKEQRNIKKLNKIVNENIDNDSLRTMNAHFQTYVLPNLTEEEQVIVKKLDVNIFRYNYDNETSIRLSFKTPGDKDDVYQLILVNVTPEIYRDMVKIVEKFGLVSDYDNKNKLYLDIYCKNKRQNMNRIRRVTEGSHSDFLMSYGKEIREAVKQLREAKKIIDNMDGDTYEQKFFKEIETELKNYDENVIDQIDHWISIDYIDADEIVRFAFDNENRFGTEKQFVLFAINDFYDVAKRYDKTKRCFDCDKELTDKDIQEGENTCVNCREEVVESLNEAKKTTKSKKDNFVEPFRKLKNLKHFHELSYDGDTTKKSNVNDDSWVKGTKEDLVRPMFKNLPDTTIRPSYDVLRTGSIVTLFGRDCRVEGIKNGELTVSVMGKDDKHETQKYDMKDVLKEIQKNNKKEKKSKK
jgi:hypothetical protein